MMAVKKNSVDLSAGNMLVNGKRVLPIGLSDPPPVGTTAPDSGLPAWAEIAGAGVSFARNYNVADEPLKRPPRRPRILLPLLKPS
jgi:hypothetical protein